MENISSKLHKTINSTSKTGTCSVCRREFSVSRGLIHSHGRGAKCQGSNKRPATIIGGNNTNTAKNSDSRAKEHLNQKPMFGQDNPFLTP